MADTETKLGDNNEEADNHQTTKDAEVSEKESFNYDRILDHLGHLGKSQLSAFLWLCLPAIFPGLAFMSYLFTGAIPGYRCFVPGCDDYQQRNDSLSEDFTPDWVITNVTVPVDVKCSRYNRTWEKAAQCTAQIKTISNTILSNDVENCDLWVYDTSVFKTTIVTEFNLTCDDEWKQPIPSVAFMVGTLIGCLTLGTLADKFGRKPTFMINLILLALVTTFSAFSPNVIVFSILRLFSGATAAGQFDVLFVWGIEGIGSKYRVPCGFMYQLMYNFGSSLLGLIAYLIRDWKTLQIIISAPLFLFIPIYWLVPESTRWLISQKRFSQATRQINEASRINGRTVPNHLMQILKHSSSTEIPTISLEVEQNSASLKKEKIEGDNNLFRSKMLVKRLLILAFIWISIDMCYFGITYSTSNLSGDLYLNYELTVLVEFPAYVFGGFFVNWVGRRSTESTGLLICGLACLATGLVPDDPALLRVILSLIGKFFVAGVYAAAYSYTAELFPTSVRAIALTFCSSLGRIGGILAPILADAGRRVDPALPYIIFSIFTIAAGVICLLLPETNNKPLPTTIQDAKDMEKNNIIFSSSCFPSYCIRGEKQRARSRSQQTDEPPQEPL